MIVLPSLPVHVQPGLADFPGMPRPETFADVLDRELTRTAPAGDAPTSGFAPRWQPPSANPFLAAGYSTKTVAAHLVQVMEDIAARAPRRAGRHRRSWNRFPRR
jgi:hypothetical protein